MHNSSGLIVLNKKLKPGSAVEIEWSKSFFCKSEGAKELNPLLQKKWYRGRGSYYDRRGRLRRDRLYYNSLFTHAQHML